MQLVLLNLKVVKMVDTSLMQGHPGYKNKARKPGSMQVRILPFKFSFILDPKARGRATILVGSGSIPDRIT